MTFLANRCLAGVNQAVFNFAYLELRVGPQKALKYMNAPLLA
jgi:hypothetical protein